MVDQLVTETQDEIVSVARLMADSYRQMVEFYQREFGLSLDEAHARVTSTFTAQDCARVTGLPPDKVSWWDSGRLLEASPEEGVAFWQKIKEEARNELRSGHRAAGVLEYDGSPWERARFLSIRESFEQDWRPRGGIELALIDVLAQSFSSYLQWLARLNQLSTVEEKLAKDKYRRDGYSEPPRVTVVEAVEQASMMVDRFNRLFLRSLRSLRDLRRYSSTVVVQNAAQINVGSVQMNNAAQVQGSTKAEAEDPGM